MPQSGPRGPTTNKTHDRAPSILVVEFLSGKLTSEIAVRTFDGETTDVFKPQIKAFIMTKRAGSISKNAGYGDIHDGQVPPTGNANKFELGGENRVMSSNKALLNVGCDISPKGKHGMRNGRSFIKSKHW